MRTSNRDHYARERRLNTPLDRDFIGQRDQEVGEFFDELADEPDEPDYRWWWRAVVAFALGIWVFVALAVYSAWRLFHG